MKGHVKSICQRMSLRKPQVDALMSLDKFLKIQDISSNDLGSVQREFSQFKSFERHFPNVCFSLATGVGKTRLMGAMLVYLYLERRIRNFLIFVPNSTILDKLVKDFSDIQNEKYVFKGIAEFAQRKPKIITAENFARGEGVRNDQAKQLDAFSFDDDVHINIFNIAKFHTEKRKIRSVSDNLEVSYFEYLSSLEDLVVFMDEAHQYRATAATKTIEELSPQLGLEFTATPYLNGGKYQFQNILFDYPLSHALRDEFLKEPAVVGRENFSEKNFTSAEQLDRLKIEDAVRLHEETKLHLRLYSEEAGKKVIKPLMLVVAKDIKHAEEISQWIESNEFFGGAYFGKVLVVHSGKKGEDEEKMVRNLLKVEDHSNLIEIVIHVDKLREGWDIANLYTMVPLRTANSKTLIEQNLGRGLRLPFGKRTGIEKIDTHSVVSHDRFNDIIDVANSENSIIRKGLLIGKDIPEELPEIKEVYSKVWQELETIENQDEKVIAYRTYEAIHTHGLNSSEEIIDYVARQVSVGSVSREVLLDTVERCCQEQKNKAILIPRISIQPRVVHEARFVDFRLDLSAVNIQVVDDGLISQNLRTGKRSICEVRNLVHENDPVTQIMMLLLEYDEVKENEENLSIVESCAQQLICHLRSYLQNEEEVQSVIRQNGHHLANVIHKQMLEHYEPSMIDWEDTINYGFLPLKSNKFSLPKEMKSINFRTSVENKILIKSMLFDGFMKSLYPIVRFDSDSERRFSVILEDDASVEKWVKPQRGTFRNIYHSNDSNYEPDFIVESRECMYLVEVKREKDLDSKEVDSKADAAVHWCHLVSKESGKRGMKPWKYLLIPHSEVDYSKSLNGLSVTYEIK